MDLSGTLILEGLKLQQEQTKHAFRLSDRSVCLTDRERQRQNSSNDFVQNCIPRSI